MEISDIKIRIITGENRLRAVSSVVFEKSLVINDIRVIEGEKNIFIAMPSRRTSKGTFRDIAHPINTETRQLIENAIKKEYQKIIDSSSQEEDSSDN